MQWEHSAMLCNYQHSFFLSKLHFRTRKGTFRYLCFFLAMEKSSRQLPKCGEKRRHNLSMSLPTSRSHPFHKNGRDTRARKKVIHSSKTRSRNLEKLLRQTEIRSQCPRQQKRFCRLTSPDMPAHERITESKQEIMTHGPLCGISMRSM